jgi:pantetheine-phosphate adenylyltransferase
MKNTKMLYAGTFDPITNGHLDLIQRGSNMCDELVVGILTNSAKQPVFSDEERIQMIDMCTGDIPNMQIDVFEGLLADYVKMNDINIVLRGLRMSMDFEYEMQMAQMNARLYDGNVETVFLMTAPDYSFVSSSIVKEVFLLNGDVRGLVPDSVLDFMKKKYNKL